MFSDEDDRQLVADLAGTVELDEQGQLVLGPDGLPDRHAALLWHGCWAGNAPEICEGCGRTVALLEWAGPSAWRGMFSWAEPLKPPGTPYWDRVYRDHTPERCKELASCAAREREPAGWCEGPGETAQGI